MTKEERDDLVEAKAKELAARHDSSNWRAFLPRAREVAGFSWPNDEVVSIVPMGFNNGPMTEADIANIERHLMWCAGHQPH